LVKFAANGAIYITPTVGPDPHKIDADPIRSLKHVTTKI